ncbi:hypothetical protein FB45DRAFT_925102 [Roridomyces roridus]|uniref:Uncharacterized protein n=1 Tax=Roridomyces roridus TaxID=1738132 RepID=A0AAD7BJL4_9AGAR|nr:hypothetical protein FB45DRAFT_925102 [Roridomyces roridus]
MFDNQYSAFFTSGLLSPPTSPPASLRSSQSSWILGPRRGSLPTDSPSLSTTDDASMFYFTLQPKRDKDEFRSFLSLDLAESQSLRSRSVRRAPSSAVDLSPVPDSPSVIPQSPFGSRYSPSTSSRPLPSAKPVPASPLPSVPGFFTPPLTPAAELPPSQARPMRKPSIASQATRASATTSTVSTRYRRKRRSKALACLEGRRPAVPTGNFMSLSEDEEEEEDVPESPRRPVSADDLSDDQLIMLIARLEDGDIDSAPQTSTRSSWASSTRSWERRRRGKKPSGVLKSFMDFHNDEDTSRFPWRSFIEIAT